MADPIEQLESILSGFQAHADIRQETLSSARRAGQAVVGLADATMGAGAQALGRSILGLFERELHELGAVDATELNIARWAYELLRETRGRYQLARVTAELPAEFTREWDFELEQLERDARSILSDADDRQRLVRQIAEMQLTQEMLSESLQQTEHARDRAEAAAQAASTAAGDTSETTYPVDFEELAAREGRISNWFRVSTIVGVVIAVGIAIAWSLDLTRPGAAAATGSRDWVAFASHLTIVAGVGTLTAYLGRLAGQHRRTQRWAQSVAVQLRSFPALVSPVSEELRGAMYVALANRVLAAPPEKNGEAEAPTITNAQAVDAILMALKRTS